MSDKRSKFYTNALIGTVAVLQLYFIYADYRTRESMDGVRKVVLSQQRVLETHHTMLLKHDIDLTAHERLLIMQDDIIRLHQEQLREMKSKMDKITII